MLLWLYTCYLELSHVVYKYYFFFSVQHFVFSWVVFLPLVFCMFFISSTPNSSSYSNLCSMLRYISPPANRGVNQERERSICLRHRRVRAPGTATSCLSFTANCMFHLQEDFKELSMNYKLCYLMTHIKLISFHFLSWERNWRDQSKERNSQIIILTILFFGWDNITLR